MVLVLGMNCFKVLLAFKVYTEKSAIVLMGFPLCVTCVFSLTALNTLSLLFIFSVLAMIGPGDFLVLSVLCVCCVYLVFCCLLVVYLY